MRLEDSSDCLENIRQTKNKSRRNKIMRFDGKLLIEKSFCEKNDTEARLTKK